jgi:hypothetical protein
VYFLFYKARRAQSRRHAEGRFPMEHCAQLHAIARLIQSNERNVYLRIRESNREMSRPIRVRFSSDICEILDGIRKRNSAVFKPKELSTEQFCRPGRDRQILSPHGGDSVWRRLLPLFIANHESRYPQSLSR